MMPVDGSSSLPGALPGVSRLPTGVLGREEVERTVRTREDIEALVGEVEARGGGRSPLGVRGASARIEGNPWRKRGR